LGVQLKLIEAAKKAGVRRFLPSEFGQDLSELKTTAQDPYFADKVKVQDALRKSGLEYTFVATGFFDNHALPQAAGVDLANGKLTIFVSSNLLRFRK